MRKGYCIVLLLLGLTVWGHAGQVEIVSTELTLHGDVWHISTTLRHDDTGWEPYADAWRVLTDTGDVLGTRVLYHPHVDEQPFTRSLSGVVIPVARSIIYVEAHDKVHGWSPQRVRVDLQQPAGERFRVNR
jgi:hypothetical protein